jgi:hypothetical protein
VELLEQLWEVLNVHAEIGDQLGGSFRVIYRTQIVDQMKLQGRDSLAQVFGNAHLLIPSELINYLCAWVHRMQLEVRNENGGIRPLL